MIVQDKESSIALANQISEKLLSIITEEIKNLNINEDPAEQIYLAIHTLSYLTAKVCLALEGYGKIYGIENLTIEKLREWLSVVTDEAININKEG